MRSTIKCNDGKPSRLHISKNGESVELTPSEAALAARLLKELRDTRSESNKTDDKAKA